jgi:hypothetical protein
MISDDYQKRPLGVEQWRALQCWPTFRSALIRIAPKLRPSEIASEEFSRFFDCQPMGWLLWAGESAHPSWQPQWGCRWKGRRRPCRRPPLTRTRPQEIKAGGKTIEVVRIRITGVI